MTSPRRSPTTPEYAAAALLLRHHQHDHQIFSALYKRRYNYYNPFEIPQNSMGSATCSSRSAPSINVEGYHFTFEHENGMGLRKVPCLQSCLMCDGGYESSSPQVRYTHFEFKGSQKEKSIYANFSVSLFEWHIQNMPTS